MDTSLPSLKRRKVSEEIYEALKERILSEQYLPGQRLHLDEIERQMDISRTPLTEALNRLETDGLVEIRYRKGTFVTKPSPSEMAQAFDVRRVLEIYAAEQALERMTDADMAHLRQMVAGLEKLACADDSADVYQRFVALDHDLHKRIVQQAGNEPLRQAWERVNVHVQIARARYGTLESEVPLAQQEHKAILAAFEARSAAALRRAMAQHIERAKGSLLRDAAGWE